MSETGTDTETSRNMLIRELNLNIIKIVNTLRELESDDESNSMEQNIEHIFEEIFRKVYKVSYSMDHIFVYGILESIKQKWFQRRSNH